MSTRTLLNLSLVALNAAFLSGAVFAQTPTPDPMATPPMANPPPANPPPPGQPLPPPPPPGGEHHHPHFMDMIMKLNLTDEQKTEIQKINDSSIDKKEKHKQIKELLTADQQTQLKELMQNPPPPPPAN